MAQPLVKFYRSATEPTGAKAGSLWFDSATNTIKVLITAASGENPAVWEPYGGNEAVVIADETETNPNFLDVESDGALAVRGMLTAFTETTKDIVVAGGPLANDVNEKTDSWPAEWKDASGNKKIPAGTSVQTLFEKLFNQELYPKTATKPSISIDGESNLGLKEVGSTVTIPALSMGKSAGKFNADYSTPAQPATGVTWSNESMTVGTPTGFTGMSTTGGTTGVAQTSGTIIEGANSVTYGASANYTAPANSPVTNLGNPTTSASYTFAAGTATATAASTTATGVYPIYANGVQLTSGDTNDAGVFGTADQNKMSLVNYVAGGKIYIGFGSTSTKEWILYIPAGVSIVAAKGFDPASRQFSTDYGFTASGTQTIDTDYKTGVSYTVYKYNKVSGPNNIELELKKS